MSRSFDELRATRKPREQTIPIPLDEGAWERIEELGREIPLAKLRDERENRKPLAPQLQTELDDLREQAMAAAEDFTFRELPRPDFRALTEAHPDPDGKLRWHEDTFAPALLAATCVSHDLTVGQWAALWHGDDDQQAWPSWIMYQLLSVAHSVCEQPARVPFGSRSSGETPGSAASSTTAPREA